MKRFLANVERAACGLPAPHAQVGASGCGRADAAHRFARGGVRPRPSRDESDLDHRASASHAVEATQNDGARTGRAAGLDLGSFDSLAEGNTYCHIHSRLALG